MLKGYEILKTIPAYDFTNAIEYGKLTTKEEQEKYKERSSKNDIKEVRKVIKHMIHKYDNGSEELFVLNAILDNPHLLKKTKLIYDGSYRNIRVCAFNYEDEEGFRIYDFDEDIKYTSFHIDWNNAVDKKIHWNDWSDFDKAITKNDIVEVLNNIEEIFIQK
jgi:hypothetical protein